jgi:hypothetical protein
VERVVLNALFLGGTRCPQRVAPVMRARRLTFVAWLGTHRLEDKTIHLVERVVLNALLLGGTRCPQRVDPSELALKPTFAVSAG